MIAYVGVIWLHLLLEGSSEQALGPAPPIEYIEIVYLSFQLEGAVLQTLEFSLVLELVIDPSIPQQGSILAPIPSRWGDPRVILQRPRADAVFLDSTQHAQQQLEIEGFHAEKEVKNKYEKW